MHKGYLEGYISFLRLNGCYLKGLYGGVLLSVLPIDGNKRLFSMTFAVVEIECKDSWRFFLSIYIFALMVVQ